MTGKNAKIRLLDVLVIGSLIFEFVYDLEIQIWDFIITLTLTLSRQGRGFRVKMKNTLFM